MPSPPKKAKSKGNIQNDKPPKSTASTSPSTSSASKRPKRKTAVETLAKIADSSGADNEPSFIDNASGAVVKKFINELAQRVQHKPLLTADPNPKVHPDLSIPLKKAIKGDSAALKEGKKLVREMCAKFDGQTKELKNSFVYLLLDGSKLSFDPDDGTCNCSTLANEKQESAAKTYWNGDLNKCESAGAAMILNAFEVFKTGRYMPTYKEDLDEGRQEHRYLANLNCTL